jgi:osmoprotectant transport system substrate-binding protein
MTHMRLSRKLALGASLLVLLSACSTGGGSKPTIKIGSVGFDEARVVAEIYAQALEAQGYTVDRAGIGLGDRSVLLPALEKGDIDLQPEYIGSGLAAGYGGTSTNDPAKNKSELQKVLDGKGGGITVLDYTPGVDTNALVVRKDTAEEYNLHTWGDLAAVQGELKFGLATDCPTNPLCGGALKDTYGIDIESADVTLLSACDKPMSDALAAKTIDVAELCSTDPLIITNDWVRLEDDKGTQPADNIAPLVRNDYLAKVDKTAFSKILNDVSAKIDTTNLAQLYYDVAVDQKDIKDVATAWLKANGFVQ